MKTKLLEGSQNFKLKAARALSKSDPATLAADPVLSKMLLAVLEKYRKKRRIMFERQYDEIMGNATLRHSVDLSLADVQGQWDVLKLKPLQILGGKSIAQYSQDLDAVLKSGNLSFGVVFKATYFYLTSLDEASKEAFRNQTQRAVGGGGGRIKEFTQVANGAKIDKKLQEQHIQDLVDLDLRQTAEDKMDEDATAVEDDIDEDPSTSNQGGSSSSTSTAKDGKPKKAYTKNRPPYVKDDPEDGGPVRPFTIRELEHFFSAEAEIFYKSRITCASKVIEDSAQEESNMLPFGVRLHRRQGAGARTNKGDGMPGFVSKVGVTVYHVTNLEHDAQGRIKSLYGVGRHGERTKAYILHYQSRERWRWGTH